MTRRVPGARRAARLLLLALLAPAVGAPAPASASHDEPRMLVSRSASGPFSDQLTGPLLTDLGRVVPLDEASGTFYLMNATPEPARATVTVVNRGDANALTGGIRVSVEVAGTTVVGRLPPDGAACDLQATGPRVRAGGVQPVEVGIVVGDLDGQQGTSQDFALDIDVTMSHLGPGAATGPCQELVVDVDDPDDGTAGSTDPDCSRTPVVTVTGTPTCVPRVVEAGLGPRDPVTAAATGAVWLVVGGLLLLLASRRRRTPPTHRAG